MSKCDTCKIDYQDNLPPCISCKDNPQLKSYYEEKINPLKNLFQGAPVITDSPAIAESAVRRYYHKYKSCFYGGTTNWSTLDINASKPWANIRLPTIDESPRNVWLAAPADGKCPEGAENLLIMGWIKEEDAPSVYAFPGITRGYGLGVDWHAITKFMIVDAGAFEDET